MSEPKRIEPDHYKNQGSQPHWERMWDLYREAWFVGNITKYVERYKKKDGIKDLLKARTYLDKLIELEEAQANREPVPSPSLSEGKINKEVPPLAVDKVGELAVDKVDDGTVEKAGNQTVCTVGGPVTLQDDWQTRWNSTCHNCGGVYPLHTVELIAGRIYCAKCRAERDQASIAEAEEKLRKAIRES